MGSSHGRCAQLGGGGGWYVSSRSCLILSQSGKVQEHERSLCLPPAHTQFKRAGDGGRGLIINTSRKLIQQYEKNRGGKPRVKDDVI